MLEISNQVLEGKVINTSLMAESGTLVVLVILGVKSCFSWEKLTPVQLLINSKASF